MLIRLLSSVGRLGGAGPPTDRGPPEKVSVSPPEEPGPTDESAEVTPPPAPRTEPARRLRVSLRSES